MKIDLVNYKATSYSVSIKDNFLTDLKDDCPIVSYSIAKVIEKKSKQPIALADYSNLFTLDSLGVFLVLQSIESYQNYLIYIQA